MQPHIVSVNDTQARARKSRCTQCGEELIWDEAAPVVMTLGEEFGDLQFGDRGEAVAVWVGEDRAHIVVLPPS